MAGGKQSAYLAYCLCFVVFVCSSVLCLPQGSQSAVCNCRPAWVKQLEPHARIMETLLKNPTNGICPYVLGNQLLTSCSLAEPACSTRQNKPFCCCPFAGAMGPMKTCLTGPIKPTHICMPSDISPWIVGLQDAFFTQTSFGK